MRKSKILVVGDENLISAMIRLTLEKSGYIVETAASGKEAHQKLYDFKPSLVVTDLNRSDTHGLNFIKTMQDLDEKIPFIVISTCTLADSAVKAFMLGAFSFFCKPLDLEGLLCAVGDGLKERRLHTCNTISVERRHKMSQDQLIGNSSKMVEIFKLINLNASADTKTILITGESGTGKELVAKAIHQYSSRSSAAFIEVNCAAIPDNLIENELFGHERGAYTDASNKQKGIFELADGGTVFLDEIGDMPMIMQSRLLKVLETRRFRRLGGEGEIEIDVRIIAATNQDLAQMVADGRFRGDLYYRLNMMNICIPPLRERLEDISAMTQYFIERLNAEYGRKVERASGEAIKELLAHPWRGNVRELRNAIERAMILEKGTVLTHFHLCKEAPQARLVAVPEPKSYAFAAMAADQGCCLAGFQLPSEGISFEEVEIQLIYLAMKNANGNQSKAAKSLKMSRDTLRYRMKKFGISEQMDQSSCGDMMATVHGNSELDIFSVSKCATC